jgi:hypothetical protein
MELNQSQVFLVFEQGAGIIHGVFDTPEKAEKAVKFHENETGWECFEVIKCYWNPEWQLTEQEEK